MHNYQNILQTKTNETGYASEYGIYKGIVISNSKFITNSGGTQINSGLIQVYIPAIHGVNLFAFLNSKNQANVPTYGDNVGSLSKDALQYLQTFCPWAEICSPILTNGGSGSTNTSGRFDIVKSNDALKYEGLVSPHGHPGNILGARGNPFAYVTVPSYSGHPRGVVAIPDIGAMVMILFHKGDLNYPVCIGQSNGALSFNQLFVLDGSAQNAPNNTSPAATSVPAATVASSSGGASSPSAAGAAAVESTKYLAPPPTPPAATTSTEPIPPPVPVSPNAPNPLLPPIN